MFQMSLTDVLLPIIMLSAAAGFALGGEPPVKHPNLLLNREAFGALKLQLESMFDCLFGLADSSYAAEGASLDIDCPGQK